MLVNDKGMTLYTLSAERGGRFICTKQLDDPGGQRLVPVAVASR